MAEILPINFPLPAENSIVSYDKSDFALGIGWVTCYGNFDGTNYNISSVPLPSTRLLAGTAGNTNNDYNWDLYFNRNTSIEGPLTVIISIDRQLNMTSELHIKIIKVAVGGGTSTIVDTVTGETLAANGSNPNSVRHATTAQVPKTLFKAGEKLRVWTRVGIVNAGTPVYIWHDGESTGSTLHLQNKQGGGNFDYYNRTDAQFLIPFKLDL